MKFNSKILIFTDLDGSLLNRDNFEFGSIKNFIKELLSHDIFIIPNSSKTAKEITNFNEELEEKRKNYPILLKMDLQFMI